MTMKKFLPLGMLVLLILSLSYYIIHKSFQTNPGYIEKRIRDLSYLRTKLVEIRINAVALTELNANKIDFLEKKGNMVSQIKEANKELVSKLSDFEEDRENSKKISLINLQQKRFDKKYGISELMLSSENIANFTNSFVVDFEEINNTTKDIYNIYLPSDYQKYKVDISAYYQGELQSNNIFTDVKSKVENIDKSKFKTKDLLLKLSQLQVLFEECLSQIDKEVIAYSDLAVCEDSLSIDELKDIAFQVELSYFASEGFLETLAELTNTAYELDTVVNDMVTELGDQLE